MSQDENHQKRNWVLRQTRKLEVTVSSLSISVDFAKILPCHLNWLSNCTMQRIIYFSSVQSCLILCNPMDCGITGLPVHHQLLEFTQTRVHRVSDAIQPSHPLLSTFSSCLQSLPASGSFQMSQLLASGGQSIGVSASASVLPMNIQDWFPWGWTSRRLIKTDCWGPSPQFLIQ